MIVCVCRNISDSNYDSLEQLLERLEQDDKQCVSCVEHIKSEIEKLSNNVSIYIDRKV